MASPDPGMCGPGNVGVSKVVGSVWSFDRQLLCSPFEALCSLDGNALAPTYSCQVRPPLPSLLSPAPPFFASNTAPSELQENDGQLTLYT